LLQTRRIHRKATRVNNETFYKRYRRNLSKYLNMELKEIPFKSFKLKGTGKTRNREITDLIRDRLSKG